MSSRARLVLGIVALVPLYLVVAWFAGLVPFAVPDVSPSRRETADAARRLVSPLPTDIQGTWYSCDVADCSKVRVVLGARTIVVAGSGGGERCISATAGIDGVEVDGSMITIAAAGYAVPAPMTVVRGGDALDIAGSPAYGGHYTKSDCTGGYRAPAAPTPEPAQRAGGGNGSAGCAAHCLAAQTACMERCGSQDPLACTSACSADAVSCAEECGL
jgi:hypothetical protein